MRHIRPTFPSEYFVVADLSDLDHATVCTRREDAQETVLKAIQRGEPWAVMRCGLDEFGRDVSFEFAPEQPDDEEENRRYQKQRDWERSSRPAVL